MTEAYTVFRETEPCKRCGDGESWTVKGPDGACIGQSWTGEDAECNAEEEAQALNAAFEAGQAACGNGMAHQAEAMAWKERAEKAEKALEMVNMLACYASEEDTDSRAAVLLQIGKLARGEVSPSIPIAPAIAGFCNCAPEECHGDAAARTNGCRCRRDYAQGWAP